MDFFNMECFISVAKHLNLSLAAKEMFISQPAMSVKINAIEEDLGVKLFNRTRHKVELTLAGKYVQKDFTYMLDYYEKVREEAKKISRSGNKQLSIGYHGPTEWANINQLIQEFHKIYPDIEVDLVVAGWSQLTYDLINGRLDVIFTEKAEVEDIPMIESEFLFRDLAAVAVSVNSTLAKYEKIHPKHLNKEKIIMSNNKSAVKSLKQINERLQNAGFNMENAKMVDHYDITIAMASAGIGIAPIPRSFKINGHHSIKYVDIDSDKIFEDFSLAWSKKNENSSIPLFRDFCRSHKW